MIRFKCLSPWTTRQGEAYVIDHLHNESCLLGEVVEIETPSHSVVGTVCMTEFWPVRPLQVGLYLKGVSMVPIDLGEDGKNGAS